MPYIDLINIIVLLLFAIYVLYKQIYIIIMNKKFGSLLYRITKKNNIILSLLSFIHAFLRLLKFFNEQTLLQASVFLGYTSVGIFILNNGYIKNEIREKGLCVKNKYILWSNIKSYSKSVLEMDKFYFITYLNNQGIEKKYKNGI
ncbi:MAG: hypothetical protein GX638_13535 [Crenarchaeota archaeon]|nr:hypothetical protein [Thermoproteota archaeon]